jgi:hypothetical protein
MKEAVIVSGSRTAIGAFGGGLKGAGQTERSRINRTRTKIVRLA